ncbi:MAG: kynureninase [Bacillota bacterium]
MSDSWMARAEEMDLKDPLRHFRGEFHLPEHLIYMDGNSLGPAPVPAERALVRAMDRWKKHLVAGWTHPPSPWFTLAEELAKRFELLVGAKPAEVAITGSATVNLHQLVATFFRPGPGRDQILADVLNFPSDLYALAGQLKLRGLPRNCLVLVESADGRTLDEECILEAMTPRVALAVLPSVLYQSGQLLDVPRLAAAARERGIIIGFDLCHSVGVVPHQLSAWGVDFAFWCNYKYINGGPGAPGGLYVHERHHGLRPGLPGWWGSDKSRQFHMTREFWPARDAGAFQIGTPPILSLAPLEGALELLERAGLEAIRVKSLALTRFFQDMAALVLAPLGYCMVTPREDHRRGGHVALEHAHAWQMVQALVARGVVPDFRPPATIRLAPAPLYNTFTEVCRVVRLLEELVRDRAYLEYPTARSTVT